MFGVGNSYAVACVIVVLVIATTINENSGGVSACDLDQATNGCRIANGACSCGYGCKSEYRYQNREQCNKALKGRSNNACDDEPCKNGGSCIQISHEPKYRCKCEGTGYNGDRCQFKCPDLHEAQFMAHFPHECIVI